MDLINAHNQIIIVVTFHNLNFTNKFLKLCNRIMVQIIEVLS